MDSPAQGTGAILRIEAILGQSGDGIVIRQQGDVLLGHALTGDLQHALGDVADILLRQLTEHDGLVDTVQELGLKGPAQLLHHGLLDAVEAGLFIGLGLPAVKAQRLVGRGDVPGAHVAGHDDDGILEVHTAALRVGDDAVLQDLQQDVPHILVGLLDLIEQHHGIGLAAHLFGELAALLVTHIAGRRANQTGHGVLLHVLGHVDTDHVVLVAEHGLSQGLAQLSLAHARGAQEQERADGPLGILQPHTAAANGLGHGGDGLILAHHALMQGLLQLQHALALVLGETGDGDTGPAGHYLGNVLLTHGAAAYGEILAPIIPLNFHLLDIVLFDVPELGGLLIVLLGDDLGLLLAQGGQLLLQALQLRGGRLGIHTHPAGGLVHQVDGLIGQETVIDIPHRQAHGGLNGLVSDGQLVVRLVLIPQALEDLNGRFGGGLAHGHRLEPALQGGVLLNVLAVFVEGGGAYHADLASGQGGLEDVGGIHGALGRACAHDGVQLIDEEDYVAVLLHLVDGFFDALLKFATVLGAGHHAGQIQRQDLLVQQLLGHVRSGNALGQALGNGRLAHTGLTNQNGVVLGAAGKDLDDPLDLLFTADDGIQLALAGSLRQIPGKFSQSLGLLALLPMGHGHTAVCGGTGPLIDFLHHGAVHLLGVDAHGVQHPDGHVIAFPQQAHEQMLGTDVPGAHAHGLGHGQLHGTLGPGGQPLGGCCTGQTLAHAALQHGADHVLGHAVFLHDPVGDAVLFPHQPQQNMLTAHIAVAHFLSGLLGQAQSLLCTGGKLIFMSHIKHILSVTLFKCRLPSRLRGQGAKLVPQAGGFLVIFAFYGGLQPLLQGIALALIAQGLLLGLVYQSGRFLFPDGLLKHLRLTRLGKLRQHPGAEAVHKRLQQGEGTTPKVIAKQTRGSHAAPQCAGVAHGLGTILAQMHLGHMPVYIALIEKGCFVLSAMFTFHNMFLLTSIQTKWMRICFKISARRASRRSLGTVCRALSDRAHRAVWAAAGATASDWARLVRMARALRPSSSPPMELMTCIKSVCRSICTRRMRMYPPPPRRLSTM